MELTLFKKEKFGDLDCDFWKDETKSIFMTSEQLGNVLGYSDPRKSINKLVERNSYLQNQEFSSVPKLTSEAGIRSTRVFSEDGIYEVTFLANTEKAKAFRRWFREILKALNSGDAKLIFDRVPQTYQEAVLHLSEVLKINQQLAPKAESYSLFMDSKNNIDASEAANLLKVTGMGRNNLFKWLRREKILMEYPRKNIPYSQYSKYFKVTVFTKGDQNYHKTYITPNGLDFIASLLKKKNLIQSQEVIKCV
jgi:prophage antirepressor-like protein